MINKPIDNVKKWLISKEKIIVDNLSDKQYFVALKDYLKALEILKENLEPFYYRDNNIQLDAYQEIEPDQMRFLINTLYPEEKDKYYYDDEEN